MSVVLFIVLYCISAWFRLYYNPQNARPWKHLLCYLSTALFLVLSKWILLKLISEPYTTKLYGYISIFTIFASVSLFLFFLYSRPITGWIEKSILKVAPHSFAVYIVHFCMMRALFCDICHLDKLVESVPLGLLALTGSCITIFTVCVLVDMGRTELAQRAGKSMRRRGYFQKYDAALERWNQRADIS